MTGEIAEWLTNSQSREFAANLLSSVPGLPPILQTIHLLSIVAIMASIVMIDLRVLGLAVPSQHLDEMIARLKPWTWWGVIVAASSGIWFVLARPNRYFSNPVFQIKLVLLLAVLILTFIFYRWSTTDKNLWQAQGHKVVIVKLIAIVSLGLWVGVVMAGRWIAYSEYLFWSE
ncbi:MAG: DUF6644 family protein [Pseudomonadota bacterium]